MCVTRKRLLPGGPGPRRGSKTLPFRCTPACDGGSTSLQQGVWGFAQGVWGLRKGLLGFQQGVQGLGGRVAGLRAVFFRAQCMMARSRRPWRGLRSVASVTLDTWGDFGYHSRPRQQTIYLANRPLMVKMLAATAP